MKAPTFAAKPPARSATPKEPIAGVIEWRVLTEDGKPLVAQAQVLFIKPFGVDMPARGARNFRVGSVNVPGVVRFEVPEGLNGLLSLRLDAGKYAPPAVNVTIENSKPTKVFEPKVTLWRSRFAVVRCVINRTGSRTLTGPNAEARRLAVTHVSQFPVFRNDWDIWQGPSGPGDRRTGDVLIARAFRSGPNLGFHVWPAGTRFEDVAEAAEDGYRAESLVLARGMLFTSKTAGPGGTAYGKFLVEDVVLEAPNGLPLLHSRAQSW